MLVPLITIRKKRVLIAILSANITIKPKCLSTLYKQASLDESLID